MSGVLWSGPVPNVSGDVVRGVAGTCRSLRGGGGGGAGGRGAGEKEAEHAFATRSTRR